MIALSRHFRPAFGIIALAFAAALSACAIEPAGRVLTPVDFSELPGWDEDRHGDALAAFLKSCGKPGGLEAACKQARTIAPGDHGAAKQFFESAFRPFAVSDGPRAEGLFTGYYQPVLKGSRRHSPRFAAPLYRRPPDLIGVDLGQFREDLKGQNLMGRVRGDRLVPYADRGEIDGGRRLAGLEIVWVEDAVEALFMQIQGSGLIELEDGSKLRIGFSAHNGHAYTAIGKVLVEMNELDPASVTMQAIKSWLRANPSRANEVMAANRRYIFFQELPGTAAQGPVGSMGVELTAERSLAVDPRFVPLGMPLWLAADAAPALRRLMIAQDTGGAITGPVRGDLYLGSGDAAGARAGKMKSSGRYWLLLPRSGA